jgi:hypothetical protein
MERIDYLTEQLCGLCNQNVAMDKAILTLQIHEGMTDGETAEVLNEIF